jgi:hypothetical protein
MADLEGLIEGVVRGDAYDIIRDIGNIPTGQTIVEAWLTIKEEFWYTSSQATIVKLIDSNITNDGFIQDDGNTDGIGKVVFSLQESETIRLHEWFRYSYDIQVKTSANKIFTPEFGILIAHPGVTDPDEVAIPPPTGSALWENYFPIFNSTGALVQSSLSVDSDVDLFYASGGAKFNGQVTVLDDPFGVGWNGNLEVPTKNAIYDYLGIYTEGSVPFANSAGKLIEDNSHFFYNPADEKLMLWNKNYRNFQGANAVISIGDLHPRYNGDTYRDVGLETFDFGSGAVPVGKYFIDVEPAVTIHNSVTTCGVFVFLHGRVADSAGALLLVLEVL